MKKVREARCSRSAGVAGLLRPLSRKFNNTPTSSQGLLLIQYVQIAGELLPFDFSCTVNGPTNALSISLRSKMMAVRQTGL